MKKVILKNFKYNLFEPSSFNTNVSTIILYHGWGTDADSYSHFAEDIANKGFRVIVPEIIYHDTRHILDNHFNKEMLQKYFWKTIVESIEEFDEFTEELGIPLQEIILIGSSMGGFIANGIFASSKNLGGLVNINGSGSFLLSERLFRKMDNRPDIPFEEEQMLRKYNPVERKNCHSPVLLMHGDSDQTVPVGGQKDYFKHLTEVEGRKDVDLLIYQNINHQVTPEMIKDLMVWLSQFHNL
jgi:alpha-beta hydrolase superfamily lysophospholipase